MVQMVGHVYFSSMVQLMVLISTCEIGSGVIICISKRCQKIACLCENLISKELNQSTRGVMRVGNAVMLSENMQVSMRRS